ncbi:hypothetical protein [Blastococcus mobilis]|uniref:Uncharacterized protein n=1 Tax=Blastococcus mobilis TaxID=1938746 RepID=A0A238Z9J4_9ACTN|nr:hypothetical protein [Blastococcus mobilis]SNR80195.1 hypothetical protein SAMN06272737_12655 [Blastococcus mobilis]
MHHVAKDLAALPGALLICRVLARAGVLIGLASIPLFVLAGAVLGPHTPGFDLVDNPTADPPRARLAGTRRRRSLGREGTCRSPT